MTGDSPGLDADPARLRKLIAEYLRDAKLMQLATAVDNQPWVCNVWFAADEDLNIYWFSAANRRHSIEVEANPLVAAAIALPHEPDEPARGVQVQGRAEVLSAHDDVRRARHSYAGRIFSEETIDSFITHAARPHRFYVIRPTQFVLFDTVNFPENSRQQLDL